MGTSGDVLLGIGVVAVLVGLARWHPAAAWIGGGVLAVALGLALAWRAARIRR